MIAPTALALLTTTFAEGAARNRALGYWAAVGSAGAIGGQLLGGLVTDTLGWRWVFLINVPVGVIVILAALRHLGDDRANRDKTPAERPPAPGIPAAILLSTGLACAIMALTWLADGGNAGYGGLLAVAAVLALGAFAGVERRHPAPMLDRRLLRIGTVARANALLALNAGTLSATLLFTTLYLQVVLGYSPLFVGLAFAPVTLLILLISPRAGALTTRYGVRAPLLAGFTLLAVGMALLARIPVDGTYLRDVLPALLLLAAGSGLAYAPTFVAGTTGVADRDQGLASGLLNSAQELGTAVGVACLGALAATATKGPGSAALAAGYRVGLLAAAVAVGVGLLLVIRLPGKQDDATTT